MKIEQRKWTAGAGWEPKESSGLKDSAQLIFLFGATDVLRDSKHFDELKAFYPNAHIWGCSTAGEIYGTEVFDDSLVATAVQFEHTQLKFSEVKLKDTGGSFEAGERLGAALASDGLTHVMVISDGLHVNGSDLVKGLSSKLPQNVAITGGLAGDGARFGQTLVYLDKMSEEGSVTALGLYGDRLKIGYGSLGGWDPFGPERVITRSEGNVLYELDGESALGLYKRYLGEHAAGLPASGLLFPLSIRAKEGGSDLVRTILAVDEKEQTMTFAGDVPQGAYGRLMKANFDRLIDGAQGAAKTSYETIGSGSPDLAILVSCVGRKLVLKQRTEEELESVREVLGEKTFMTGFYSYGEICPAAPNASCELHNQTMTITTLSER